MKKSVKRSQRELDYLHKMNGVAFTLGTLRAWMKKAKGVRDIASARIALESVISGHDELYAIAFPRPTPSPTEPTK